MPTITLKDIPEDVHAKLKEAAAAEGRSLNKEILVRLKISLLSQRPKRDVEAILTEAERVRGLFKGSLSQRDLDRWKRQGRP